MSYRTILAILSIAVVSASKLHAETQVYGVLTNTPDTPYWQSVQLGLREGAHAEQVDYYAQTLKNAEPNTVLTMCNSMLDRKPNILLVALPDSTALSTCFEKAQGLNIPVISIGDSDIQHGSENISSFVLTDHNEAAAIGASYIASTLGSNAEGTVIIPDTKENKLAVKSFTEKLMESAPSLEVLVSSPEELINVAPDIRAIISVDNSSILNAVSDQLSDSDVLILSIDNKADNPSLLANGKIHASVTPLPYLLGKRAMEHASQTINNDSIEEREEAFYIKPVLLTKQILDEGNDPMLEYVK